MLEETLKYYPSRIADYEERDGMITVSFINPNPNIIERTFFKKLSQKPVKIDFDEFGSFVWKLCDGKLTVKEIAETLKANFGKRAESAEERVSKFVVQLNRNKLIQLYKKVNKD